MFETEEKISSFDIFDDLLVNVLSDSCNCCISISQNVLPDFLSYDIHVGAVPIYARALSGTLIARALANCFTQCSCARSLFSQNSLASSGA